MSFDSGFLPGNAQSDHLALHRRGAVCAKWSGVQFARRRTLSGLCDSAVRTPWLTVGQRTGVGSKDFGHVSSLKCVRQAWNRTSLNCYGNWESMGRVIRLIRALFNACADQNMPKVSAARTSLLARCAVPARPAPRGAPRLCLPPVGSVRSPRPAGSESPSALPAPLAPVRRGGASCLGRDSDSEDPRNRCAAVSFCTLPSPGPAQYRGHSNRPVGPRRPRSAGTLSAGRGGALRLSAGRVTATPTPYARRRAAAAQTTTSTTCSQ